MLSVHGTDLRLIIFTAPAVGEAADKLRLLTVLGTENMSVHAPGTAPEP